MLCSRSAPTPTVPSSFKSAVIQISSNDPTAPNVDLLATGTLETTPPNISSAIASPDVLWPPNHKMVPLILAVSVTDNCDPAVAQSCRILSIGSNEPVMGIGEGDTSSRTGRSPVASPRTCAPSDPGRGRAESTRSRFSARDSAGNRSIRTTTVTVPPTTKNRRPDWWLRWVPRRASAYSSDNGKLSEVMRAVSHIQTVGIHRCNSLIAYQESAKRSSRPKQPTSGSFIRNSP